MTATAGATSELSRILIDTAAMGNSSEFSLDMKRLRTEGMSSEEAWRQTFTDYVERVVDTGVRSGRYGLIAGLSEYGGAYFEQHPEAFNALVNGKTNWNGNMRGLQPGGAQGLLGLPGATLAPGGRMEGMPILPGPAVVKDDWETALEEALADEAGPGAKSEEDIDSSWEDAIMASTGDVFKRTPELEGHIQYVDPSTPRKRGIGGAHSSEEFFKNDVQIVKSIPSQDIPGVTYYQYNLPLLGKDGQPMGGYGITIFEKTVYDPSIFSFQEYMRRGLEAANDSYRTNKVLGDYWEGFDSFGVKWVGYGQSGKPTSFFPHVPKQ